MFPLYEVCQRYTQRKKKNWVDDEPESPPKILKGVFYGKYFGRKEISQFSQVKDSPRAKKTQGLVNYKLQLYVVSSLILLFLIIIMGKGGRVNLTNV
jgi:hypothetical protein